MSQNLPLVSIVTPSFNQARYIDATLQSVLTQDYPSIECIVTDGASTDNTVEILRHYETRIIWTSEPDHGQADAINKGFSRSHGQILGWLNSDDTLEKSAVTAAVQFLSAHPDVSMVYGDANFIDSRGQFIVPCAHIEPFSASRLIHYSDFIVQPAAFFRRDAFESVGALDPSLHYAMDYDLWLKFAAQFKIAYLPKVLANYRWLGENKSAVGGWNRLEEVERVARRHGASRLPAYFRLEAINLLLQQAASDSRQGKPIAAGKSMARAATSLLSNWRAMRSLISPQTWRIIRTGQILRAAGNHRNSHA